MDMVEVVARIGDSTIALVHLEPGQRFVIGSEPGCDLAVRGIGRFPLVEGDLVRIPAGVRASADGALRLGDTTVEVELGLAVVTIRKLPHARVPVPRPRFDIRMPAFLLASLITLVAVWAAAAIVAPYAPPPQRPRILPLHLAHPAPPKLPAPPKQPPPPPQARVQTTPTTGPERPRVRQRSRSEYGGEHATEDGFAALSTFAKNWKDPVVTLDGSGAGPESYEGHYFGNALRFDPDSDPAFDTVKAKEFATATAGKGVGQTLPAPRLVFCDDDSCEAHGGIALATFVAALERHRKQIQDCYVDHTDQIAGSIRLRFGVAPDGKAFATRLHLTKDSATTSRTHVVGAGIGTVGECVAKILDKESWPRASAETEVWLGVAFLPGAAPD